MGFCHVSCDWHCLRVQKVLSEGSSCVTTTAELHKTHRPGAPPVGARGTPVPPRVIVKLKAYVSGVPAYYMHMLRQGASLLFPDRITIFFPCGVSVQKQSHTWRFLQFFVLMDQSWIPYSKGVQNYAHPPMDLSPSAPSYCRPRYVSSANSSSIFS